MAHGTGVARVGGWTCGRIKSDTGNGVLGLVEVAVGSCRRCYNRGEGWEACMTHTNLCGDGRWWLDGKMWYGRGNWGCRQPYWLDGSGGWRAVARAPVWEGGAGWYRNGTGSWDVGSCLEADASRVQWLQK